MRAAAVAIFVALFSACAPSLPPIDADAQSLGESLQARAPVYVLDSGHYPGDYIYNGSYYDNVWVDLSIRDDAFDKQAGIVWTNDGWQTQHTAAAAFKGTLPDGRERWGMDIKDAIVQGAGGGIDVEYAAFVTMNGQTSWSPFRNHYIYGRVTPAQPLRVLSTGATAGAVHGVVRALNVPGPRRVFVRYSFDGWQTMAEVEATPAAPDFAFSLPIAGDPARVDEVAFAVRLEANGEVAWDNAGGANHHVQLAPTLTQAAWGNATAQPSSGIKVLSGAATTALPVTAVRVLVDDGSVIALPAAPSSPTSASRFDAGGGFMLLDDTSALADGTHAFTVEIAAGAFVRQFPLPSLSVVNTLRALGGAAAGIGETPWDFLRAGDATYVLGDQHLFRYAAGASTAQTFEAPGVGLAVGQLAVDAAGRVYVVAATHLVRWNGDGTLDRSFGVNGVLALDASWDGVGFCYGGDVAADANGVYVVDSCNTRVLRFALDGRFVDSLSLAAGGYTQALHTAWRGGALWVSRSRFDTAAHYELAEVGVAAGQPMQIGATLPLAVPSVDGVAFATDGLWVTSQNDLHRLGSDGALVGEWTGGGGTSGTPTGSLEIARRVSVRADGTVDVLSTGSGRIERFARR